MIAQLKSWIHMLKFVGLSVEQVFVYDADDLPRTSSGVVQFEAGVIYHICGAIDISDRPLRRPKGSR